jgi:hypothetical protein
VPVKEFVEAPLPPPKVALPLAPPVDEAVPDPIGVRKSAGVLYKPAVE